MDAKPRFLPGRLIEIRAYDGRERSETAEVYKVTWSYEKLDWLYHVRCFVPVGQEPKFRNFYEGRLVAE